MKNLSIAHNLCMISFAMTMNSLSRWISEGSNPSFISRLLHSVRIDEEQPVLMDIGRKQSLYY